MSSHYNHLTYKLKERIYENNDKTIVIFKTRKKQTIKYIAVKAYSKKDHEGTYDKEYKILKTITHPSIIKVLGSAEDKFNFYMEMEFCASGNLSNLIWKNKTNNYLEKVIKMVSTQLLLGLKKLHSNGIIHCNLKPSNIVIDEFGNVKICDFKRVLNIKETTNNDIKRNKSSMTPCYTAPELFSLNGVFSFKTDLWALGCIMYEMAVGQVPFSDDYVHQLVYKIINDDVNFNKKQLQNYSMEFIDVLKKLLEKNPDNRISWGEIEKYPFWEFEREKSTSNSTNSSFNDNSSPKSNKHNTIGNSLSFGIEYNNNNNNSNNNKNNIQILKEDDDDYSSFKKDNKTNNTDQEFNFQNPLNYNLNKEKEDNNYSGKFNNLNSNSLSSMSMMVSKVIDRRDKRATNDFVQDIAMSMTKPDELPQIQEIMIDNSDRIVKQIIGNKTIDTPENLNIDYDNLDFSPVLKLEEIKELFFNEKFKLVQDYLLNIYQLMDNYSLNNQQNKLLNLLNYFETIIRNKEISNNLVNSIFMDLLIKFLDINNDDIRIRSCIIIGYFVRYSTSIETPLKKYNLIEKLISFISDDNVKLNRSAIATLGEYLFFVAAQAEGEIELDSEWIISKEEISSLLFALNHSDEKVRFYSLKTIENISCKTTISNSYFASNDDFIRKILDIYNDKCDNCEIHTSALNTCSYLIRNKPSLLKVFIDKVDVLNIVLEKENPRNQQCIINCLLFGIVGDVNNIKILNLDDIIPECINLLENSNKIIKSKIILLFSLLFNDADVIIKYGEKVFELMKKLRQEKEQFYYYVKIYESFLINFCNNIIKYFISISDNNKNYEEIICLLDAFNIIAPYQKVSFAIYNTQFLNSLINILNYNISNPDDILITKTFDLLKSFSENPYSVEQNSDLIIKKMFNKILSLTLKLNDNYKRFPLNICANILTVLLDDEKLYSATIIEEGKTNQINSLIITILPTIYNLLKNPDTVQESLSFLSLIIERNSAFIKFYRSIGIINEIFLLMKEDNFYSNLNLIKILIKLIESNDTEFDDIIQLDLIDKVNYMISKDSMEDITIYTEYVIEMFFDLMFKINDAKKQRYSDNFDKDDYKKNFTPKIEAVAINFKLCIKLLGCENTNIQEKACICLIFMLQFFPNGRAESVKINVAFTSEDIPNLLNGLDMNCKKIHKKMISIFKWIIEYQTNAKIILKNYVSFLQTYIERIRDMSDNQAVINNAKNFLQNELIKIQ